MLRHKIEMGRDRFETTRWRYGADLTTPQSTDPVVECARRSVPGLRAGQDFGERQPRRAFRRPVAVRWRTHSDQYLG